MVKLQPQAGLGFKIYREFQVNKLVVLYDVSSLHVDTWKPDWVNLDSKPDCLNLRPQA